MTPLGQSYSWTVPEPAPRLDLWLVSQLPELSRSRIASLATHGQVTLNGHPAKPSQKLKSGDLLQLEVPPPEAALPQPEELPLDIVFEDSHILVLNKPPDLVVHPGAGHGSGTLVNALLHHCQGSLSGIGGVERPGIVHRLDKDTSGLMVIAKNDPAHRSLSDQFQGRSVEKIYWALCTAAPRPASGTIDKPIGRHPTHRQKMCISQTGRPSTTLYSTRAHRPGLAWIECRLLTGRTHQIRVHLASLGCPLLGDAVYGRPSPEAPRQMLHSAKLAFDHPATGQRIQCEAPLPSDMKLLVDSLKK